MIGVHIGANKEPKSSNNIGNFIKLAIDKFKNKENEKRYSYSFYKSLTQNKNNEFSKRQIEPNQKIGQKIEKMVKNTTTNISDNVSISYE